MRAKIPSWVEIHNTKMRQTNMSRNLISQHPNKYYKCNKCGKHMHKMSGNMARYFMVCECGNKIEIATGFKYEG